MNAKQRWELYRMPESLSGESFLDIGCWRGDMSAEALRRGAECAVGVDMVKSPQIIKEPNFYFYQIDVMSHKFLELRRFDYVLCAGVLYHVESPIDLLVRLKSKVEKTLYLETEVFYMNGSFMKYCAGNSYDNNYSNWWVPTDKCVRDMGSDCGFTYPMKVYESQDKKRACYLMSPENRDCKKVLPRRHEYMEK